MTFETNNRDKLSTLTSFFIFMWDQNQNISVSESEINNSRNGENKSVLHFMHFGLV